MSLVADILNDGLSAHLSVSGCALTFRGVDVIGSVEWGPADIVTGDGELDFEGRDCTSVMISKSDVETKPEKGESFKDPDDKYHRVQSVHDLENVWRCICLVSE